MGEATCRMFRMEDVSGKPYSMHCVSLTLSSAIYVGGCARDAAVFPRHAGGRPVIA